MEELENNLHKPISFTNKAIEMEEQESKSGFYDLNPQDSCVHPGHYPPMHLHIPQGKGYKHVCPSCGKVTNLVGIQISFGR